MSARKSHVIHASKQPRLPTVTHTHIAKLRPRWSRCQWCDSRYPTNRGLRRHVTACTRRPPPPPADLHNASIRQITQVRGRKLRRFYEVKYDSSGGERRTWVWDGHLRQERRHLTAFYNRRMDLKAVRHDNTYNFEVPGESRCQYCNTNLPTNSHRKAHETFAHPPPTVSKRGREIVRQEWLQRLEARRPNVICGTVPMPNRWVSKHLGVLQIADSKTTETWRARI